MPIYWFSCLIDSESFCYAHTASKYCIVTSFYISLMVICQKSKLWTPYYTEGIEPVCLPLQINYISERLWNKRHDHKGNICKEIHEMDQVYGFQFLLGFETEDWGKVSVFQEGAEFQVYTSSVS